MLYRTQQIFCCGYNRTAMKTILIPIQWIELNFCKHFEKSPEPSLLKDSRPSVDIYLIILIL